MADKTKIHVFFCFVICTTGCLWAFGISALTLAKQELSDCTITYLTMDFEMSTWISSIGYVDLVFNTLSSIILFISCYCLLRPDDNQDMNENHACGLMIAVGCFYLIWVLFIGTWIGFGGLIYSQLWKLCPPSNVMYQVGYILYIIRCILFGFQIASCSILFA